jgi:hypothetical protein
MVADEPPRVLIAGPGLVELFLDIRLEMAGIPYDVYERATEIKAVAKRTSTIRYKSVRQSHNDRNAIA